MFDHRDLQQAYKIAHELLESIEKNLQNESDSLKFESPQARQLLGKLSEEELKAQFKLNKNCDSDNDDAAATLLNEKNDAAASDLETQILQGTSVCFKKALDYLANTLKFKVVYQSLLGVNILNFFYSKFFI
jgi:hypothetical protein